MRGAHLDSTRRSWNAATRNHNAHKGDQVAFLRGGGDTLFPEELSLLGELAGKRLVHLLCNAGQDTVCLARRGAACVGVDLSDEAVAFARRLSEGAELPATFVEAEAVAWLETTPARFDVAFASYGALPWLEDLDAWARGVHRVLSPGGRLVLVEFHPVAWSVGPALALDGDDYFATAPFVEPVSDYVAASGAGLGAVTQGKTEENTTPACAWQHGVAEAVDAVARASLRVERLLEWPYSNGCRVHPALVPAEGRRFVWPPGTARVPLMFGLSARRA